MDPVNVLLHPAVAGVMMALPHPGTVWPDVERAKFMCALGAVLDLIYEPTQDSASQAQENQHGE